MQLLAIPPQFIHACQPHPAKILYMIQQPFDQPTHDLQYVSTLFRRALLSESTLEFHIHNGNNEHFHSFANRQELHRHSHDRLERTQRVLCLLCLLGLLSRSNIQQKGIKETSTTTKTENHQYILSENLNHLTISIRQVLSPRSSTTQSQQDGGG